MNALHNNFGDCAAFKPVKRCVRSDLSHVLSRVLLSGVVALMCFNSALALDINQANEAELDTSKAWGPRSAPKCSKPSHKAPSKTGPM